MADRTTEIADLSERDRRVLRAMDDEWLPAARIASETGLGAKVTLGTLQSLRARGLVTYRPASVTAHEHTRSGDWALSNAGDQLVWGISSSPG